MADQSENKSEKKKGAKASGGFERSVKRRRGGGIGADGKPVAPAIITAVVVIMLFVAIYFGTVSGWFGGGEDPASIDATIPPEVTPLPAMSTSQPISALDDKTLTVFAANVGQGSCTLLISPNGKTMLVDSGDDEHYLSASALLISNGVKKLDVVIASSPGAGSIGAMSSFIEDFEVGGFYGFAGLEEAEEYAEIAAALEKKGVELRSLPAAKSTISWDKSCKAEVSGVGGEGSCLALRVSHGDYSLLLCGMADAEGEASIVSAFGGSKTTVLFVPAFGGDGAASSALLSSVRPEYAVISCNGPGFPADDTLSRLNSRGVKLYRTDKNGTVKIVIDKDGIRFV